MKTHDQAIKDLIEKTKRGKVKWEMSPSRFIVWGGAIPKWSLRYRSYNIEYKYVRLDVSTELINQLVAEIEARFARLQKKREEQILAQLEKSWWKKLLGL